MILSAVDHSDSFFNIIVSLDKYLCIYSITMIDLSAILLLTSINFPSIFVVFLFQESSFF